MNSLFKALLKEISDCVKTGEDLFAKNWSAVIADIVIAGEDVPAIINNWSDIENEAKMLIDNPAADADLVAYAVGLCAGMQPAALNLIQTGAQVILVNVQTLPPFIRAIEGMK
jgi:hypothetical protein